MKKKSKKGKKKMKDNNNFYGLVKLLLICFITSLFTVILIFSNLFGVGDEVYYFFNTGFVNSDLSADELVMVNDCNSSDLISSVFCLQNRIEGFYKYKLTPDFVSLSFDQLRDSGGDCKDWADLWVKLVRSMGFGADHLVVPVDKVSSHGVSVLYDESGYCFTGNSGVKCFHYNMDDGDDVGGVV